MAFLDPFPPKVNITIKNQPLFPPSITFFCSPFTSAYPFSYLQQKAASTVMKTRGREEGSEE